MSTNSNQSFAPVDTSRATREEDQLRSSSQPLQSSFGRTPRSATVHPSPGPKRPTAPIGSIARLPSPSRLRPDQQQQQQQPQSRYRPTHHDHRYSITPTPTLIRSRSTSGQHSSSPTSHSPEEEHHQLQPEPIAIDEKCDHQQPGPLSHYSAYNPHHRLGRPSNLISKPISLHRILRHSLERLSRFKPTSLTVSIEGSTHHPTTPMMLQNPSTHQFIPARPSRWFSLEFCLYWLILAYSLKLVIGSAVQLSQVEHPNYPRFKHKLSKGWILGRKIDNSDSQYRRFRLGSAQLVLLAIGYLSLSKLSKTLQLSRAHFQSISSALILTALHGTSVIKILLIVGSNYLISRRFLARPTKISSSLVWLLNLIILFANDYWDGYRFRHLSASLAFLDAGPYRGLIPRWQIGFNISMLRLISYAFDYRWAAQNSFQNQTVSSSEPELEKERVKFNRIESDYCFQNYFNYVFYPPLYIAGPIITFNNFISQMNQKPASVTSRTILGFFARFLTCFLTLEWILHYMYVVAIKDAKAWQGDSPFELGIIGYWNLIIIWLKLLIPWRFFRLWSLLDGVDPPENMVRCMSNNYSTLEFWRSWHRSYNLWIVRYLYIPLGGSNNMILSTIVVFTFVALWHDLSFKLLTWGWLVSFFVLPEVIAKKVFANSAYQHEPWFRHLVAFGGTFNVMAMMSANLVGFSIGVDGVKFMWKEMLGSWAGLKVFVTILLVVFCAVQVMIEYRSAEKREGINRKC